MDAQVLIIGGGIAGGIAALGLADRGIPVVLIRPSASPEDTASFHAQGGIIYRGEEESPRALEKDIWDAGARCGDRRMISLVARQGPEAVERILLDRLKIPFDRAAEGSLSLTREGGHRRSRIIHARDATGRAIMEGLETALVRHPLITRLTGRTALELLTETEHAGGTENAPPRRCWGAKVLNDEGRVETIPAPFTILATGGVGRLFRRTSNPPGARGDGVALAHRAGAGIADMEYVQFHPTALALPDADPFLISEAVRGAGARLVSTGNVPFMKNYAPHWGDLAPRDVVSRAIYHEMRKEGSSHVCLNFFDHLPGKQIRDRFPTIYRRCREAGIDITAELLPVAPAAHFSCGGIAVDRWGETSLQGLFALGECSRTGIHGANRLASTSLLEGLVWADRAALKISRKLTGRRPSPPRFPGGEDSPDPPPDRERDRRIERLEGRIRRIMWDKVGIIRESPVLGEAVEELREIGEEADRLYRSGRPTVQTAGLHNMAATADLIARAAHRNRVSRGCHFVVS